MKKRRRYFFTWNNWNDFFETKEAVFDYFKDLPHIKGFVIGFEVGEQGTPHLQGVILFNQHKTFNTIRDYLKNNHIEPIIKLDSAIEYCKKDNDFIEFGDVTGQGARNDIEDFRDGIINGLTDIELLEQFPTQYFRYERSIERVRQMYLNEYYSKNNRDLKVIYLAGDTGSGKTSFVYRNFDISQVYRVTDYNNPFDNYQGQKILVLDEFHGQFEITQMLNILDIYPNQLPARYNNKWACYEIVFIISNRLFIEQYKGIQEAYPETFDALKRRVHKKYYLTTDNRNTIYQEINFFLDNLPF